MYTPEDIKEVLQNTFKTVAKDIYFEDENNGNYKFEVVPEFGITLDDMNDIGQDLLNSSIFDVDYINDIFIITYLNPFVLEHSQFKMIYESINNTIEFNTGQINYIKSIFKTLHTKYQTNAFLKSVYDKAINNGKLTKNQQLELEFVLKNGKTRYEANK